MVKLGSEVAGVHDGKRFKGKLVASISPLPGMEIFEETLYRVELPDGKRIDVTANQFMEIGSENAEKAK